MKRFLTFTMICMLALGVPAISVSASSLDDVVNGQNQQTTQVQTTDTSDTSVEQSQPTASSEQVQQTTNGNRAYVDEIKQATDLSETTPGASKLNEGIKKVASFIVQVLSYFITAFLVVRIILDMCYIVLPFTRSFLANGYMGNVQAGVGMADGGMGMQGGMGGMNGMGGMGMGSPMGGMGMNGMGMGGMRGGYGMRGGMGMGGMRGGMGMQGGMPGQGMQGANPIAGRIQWVSTAALNAVAAESSGGLDGKPDNALKVYIKEMIVVLILTPILLVLAITGALTDLGFLVGDLLVNGIQQIGNMI